MGESEANETGAHELLHVRQGENASSRAHGTKWNGCQRSVDPCPGSSEIQNALERGHLKFSMSPQGGSQLLGFRHGENAAAYAVQALPRRRIPARGIVVIENQRIHT